MDMETATESCLECLYGLVVAELAHVYALVGGAAGERVVALPVHVQRRRPVVVELLDLRALRRIPDDRRLEQMQDEKRINPINGGRNYTQ